MKGIKQLGQELFTESYSSQRNSYKNLIPSVYVVNNYADYLLYLL